MRQPRTSSGRAGLAAMMAAPGRAVAAFDYDGTLAPIVDDPAEARPHPDVVPALAGLSSVVGQVVILTGRPAQVAVDLAGLAGAPGLERLLVVGHYGRERWDAESGRLETSAPPEGLAAARAELPELLDDLGLGDADVEDKGISVAVHVRRLPDATAAFEHLAGPLRELARRHGLAAEPGRLVMELRSPGMDKGVALRELVGDFGAGSVMFVGDDLGDLAAFDAVDALRSEGLSGLLVCSGSEEVTALANRADLVVDGPAGVAELVTALTDELSRRTNDAT